MLLLRGLAVVIGTLIGFFILAAIENRRFHNETAKIVFGESRIFPASYPDAPDWQTGSLLLFSINKEKLLANQMANDAIRLIGGSAFHHVGIIGRDPVTNIRMVIHITLSGHIEIESLAVCYHRWRAMVVVVPLIGEPANQLFDILPKAKANLRFDFLFLHLIIKKIRGSECPEHLCYTPESQLRVNCSQASMLLLMWSGVIEPPTQKLFLTSDPSMFLYPHQHLKIRETSRYLSPRLITPDGSYPCKMN